MEKTVHYVPVGFDYERLVQPFSQEPFDPDRVVLVYSDTKPEREREAELAEHFVSRVENTLQSAFDYEVETISVENLYDYTELFKKGHNWFSDELENGYEVFVNISSMPRTVAFAFATAVDTLIVNDSEKRGSIHTYYVSPEKYMMMDAWDELEEQMEFLHSLEEEDISSGLDQQLNERLQKVSDILDCLNNGVTNGIREMSDGKHHIEFVAPPTSNLNNKQMQLLRVLDYLGGMAESISSLSDKHSSLKGTDSADGHEGTVQYNIRQLEDKGFIQRTEDGRRHRISLTKTGELWASISSDYTADDFYE